MAASLDAVDRAIGHVADTAARCGIAVVLDACTDRSRDLVTAWRQHRDLMRSGPINIVETDVVNVGQARQLGFASLLQTWSDTNPTDIWLATTDADSEVPANWISSQLSLRSEGGQVWAGGVTVTDWSDRRSGTAERWRQRYEAEHLPIHGANFGIEAALYLEAGGFEQLATGEDRALFERTVAMGAVIGHDPTVRVVTSGRRDARAPRGFAHALTALEASVPPSTGECPEALR